MDRVDFNKVITFDGTSASGKGTIAKKVAQNFSYAYLDTGKLYRALSLLMIKKSITNPQNSDLHSLVVEITPKLLSSNSLYDEKVTNFASKIAARAEVREVLVHFQKDFINNNKGVVLDGRDTGSIICPKAKFKFYIDADIEVRARRRYLQNQDDYVKQKISLQQIKNSLLLRDKNDKERKIAPLIIPEGAHIIDNSYDHLEQIIKKIIDIIDYCT